MILNEKQIEMYKDCIFLTESSDEVNRLNTYKTIYSKIKKLLPKFEKLKFYGMIDKHSYSIEFWVYLDGKRKQNYQLEDEVFYTEKEHEKVCEEIVRFIKTTNEYKNSEDKIYKLKFTWGDGGWNKIDYDKF